METPWGDIAVSDAHVHFFSRPFLASLGEPDAVAAKLNWEAPEDAAELGRKWAAQLDLHGVARAALIASTPGDHTSVETALAAVPGRFHGFFMTKPGAPVAEILQRGLQVPCLFPAMHAYSLHDPGALAIFEAAAARSGCAMFVHCGVLTVGVRKRLGLPSRFDMRYSNPLDLHAIALRFPNLPIIVPHFGAGMFREALMLADLCPNVYLDTSSTNSWMRYEGLDLKTVFRRALDVVGPSRLLFGTDSSFFPRGWHREIFERQVRALSELEVSAADAALILGKNLERLLYV